MVFELKAQSVEVKIDYENGLVTCVRKGSAWQMLLRPWASLNGGARVEPGKPDKSFLIEAATSFDVHAEYTHLEGTEMRLYTRIALEKISGDLRFEIRAEGDKAGEIEYLCFPGAWESTENGLYTVLPRSQGELIANDSPLTVDKGKIFERTAFMPMFGQYTNKGAYLAVYETPWDASYDYASGRVTPLWRTSLGTLRYQRRMLYRFLDGDYNDIAKAYRTYVKEKGQLITLRAKAALNPKVELLSGCPVIHTGITVHISPDSRYYVPDDPEHNDHFVSFDERAAQIRQLKRKGLKKAYTHFDGWGVRGYDNLHPLPLPPSPVAGGAEGMKRLMDAVKECGYLFGIHDQYRDYYYDSPFFTWDEARQNLDGSHSHNHTWHGGHYAYLCAAKAVEYVRSNYTNLKSLGIYPDSAYLDVFSLAELDECFNPRHKMSREQSVACRRECLDLLTAQGIIPTSEETLDCILPSQVMCHHAPFNADDLSDPARAVGIPLFNLVYHDCVIIPWIGLKGEKGQSGLPDGMSTYLYAMLNADPVYCPIDADEGTIRDVEQACALSGKLMYTEMLRHEFLSPDGLKQRVTYADGTAVEVDMERGSCSVEPPRA
ncbi:MAG: hypothetical protein II875_09385 [Clostridia bacterium]|nr:hypothetical protein [Clostridia bacterium]